MSFIIDNDTDKLETSQDVVSHYDTSSSVLELEPEAIGTQAYLMSIERCCDVFGTDMNLGLTKEKALQLLDKYGPNNLGADTKISISGILIHQSCNAMILVLLISMVILFAIHDWITGGVITIIIGLNVVIGGYQEYRAEKTMGSLKSLSTPTAKVIRDGRVVTIQAEKVVPGDLVTLRVGDTIPADLRLIESANFETDEALLTGESIPIAKKAEDIYSQEIPVGDRLNMAFCSSSVSKGRGTGVAVLTGLHTEIGKIASSLKEKRTTIKRVENKEDATLKDYARAGWTTIYQTVGYVLGTTEGTPLKKKLSKLAIYLFLMAVVLAIVVMASQKFRVSKEVAIYAICLALSMIPSSLVAVLTITMAIGAKEMVKRNVIVRKMDALEHLGSVNAICSDKTGTLTQGRMIARNVYIPYVGTFSVEDSDEPFNPNCGTVLYNENSPSEIAANDWNKWISYEEFLEENENSEKMKIYLDWIHTASLANIAVVLEDKDEESGEMVWKARGDPTEIAIQVFVSRIGYSRTRLVKENELFSHLAEFPFDSSVKRMSAVYKDNSSDSETIYTKGAVERVLQCCSNWYDSKTGEISSIDESTYSFINENVDALSLKGLRVLAFAKRECKEKRGRLWGELERGEVERDLTLLGIIGIYDPPRPESLPSVKKCHKAGISVHMATGDHPSTAKAIAQEVGILPHNLFHYSPEVVKVMVMTATQFDALSDEEIDNLPVLPLVIARCAPQTKVRLVDALHRRKQIVAMTGDGVNDSPSLKKSDIGIAMGKNGSDVAKDASDIVLSDDNFASILNAIEEGRRMSDNIQKFILQLLSLNLAQALFLMIGLVFRDNNGYSVFPLSPVEVLWVIVATSCFPAMGLGVEKATEDIMEKPPKDAKDAVFTTELLIDMCVYGVVIACCCMAPFVICMYAFGNADFGTNCNNTSFAESCYHVFRARSCAFAVMVWCALLVAWEVVHLRRSMFLMHPETERPYTQWICDLWSNQLLFWSIIAGFVTVFPTIYIPVINTKVFLHDGISYEWGFSFAFSLLFLGCAEIYKWFKRHHYRRHEKAHNPEYDLEKNSPFARYSSFSRANTGIPELEN
ncbi:DEKNAAC100316 [Brettanomyces naardenensis]|uniref:P-type Na(+) transporter n=1 Tax=Brettanomyces naardenensis TaxID=13370 RepID=A0A448YEE3_BRENA|nr:DEKNAAC100316 [Brettanomyces naardenensis]